MYLAWLNWAHEYVNGTDVNSTGWTKKWKRKILVSIKIKLGLKPQKPIKIFLGFNIKIKRWKEPFPFPIRAFVAFLDKG